LSLDLTTLRFLKSRERYARLARVIPQQALDTRTTTLMKDFGRYFREFQDAQVIEPSSFRILFSQLHPKLSDEDVAFYHSLFDDVVSEDVPAEVEAGLMQRLAAAATAYDLMKDIEAFNNGEEIDLRRATEQRIQDFDAFVLQTLDQFAHLRGEEIRIRLVLMRRLGHAHAGRIEHNHKP